MNPTLRFPEAISPYHRDAGGGYPLWHCFKWRGPRAALDRADLRADPAVPLPPLRLRDWLSKPDCLLAADYHSAAAAERWISEEMRTLADAPGVDRAWYHAIQRAYLSCRCDLRQGHDTQWHGILAHDADIWLAVVAEYRTPAGRFDVEASVRLDLPFVATYQADDALDALGDPSRRAIIARLADRPRAVGELADELPISRPAVSQHLKVLKNAGMVTERAVGTRRIYRLNPAGVAALRDQLDTFWSRALANYQDAVEQQEEENS